MAACKEPFFCLQHEKFTEKLLKRVQFSVSSSNAQSTVCDSIVYVFGASMPSSSEQVEWKYITSGIVAMLRQMDPTKRKYKYCLDLWIHHVRHGVLIWSGNIPQDCNYTVVASNFHVLAIGEGEVILGLMIENEKSASNFHNVVRKWIEEIHEGKKKGAKSPQNPTGISRPFGFEHVQSLESLEQLQEIEDIKARVTESVIQLRPRSRTESNASSRLRLKTGIHRHMVPFSQLEVPEVKFGALAEVKECRENPPSTQSTSEGGDDMDDLSLCSYQLGRLSPLFLEKELASFGVHCYNIKFSPLHSFK